MIVLSSYCGNDTHLYEAWREHGLTHCFLSTVSSCILFGFIFIFGGVQILVYRKYSTVLESRCRPKSALYKMQIMFCVLMSLESILHFALKATVIGDKTVYVYDIVSASLMALAWPLAIAVTCLERKRLLPSIPTRGHGLVLLIFWSLAFINENVAFLSWFSDDWWWQNRNKSKKIELGLWIARYTATGVLFVLGFVAPGVPKSYMRNGLNGIQDDEEAFLGPQDNRQSTWSNIKKKGVLLWPYVWPKRSLFLQFCVIFCLVLLVIGRVVNLFTPIYYKYIVDSLTITKDTVEDMVTVNTADNTIQVHKLQFRWDYILMYIFLRFLQGGGVGSSAFLNNMRSITWIKVQQYTSREIGVKLYQHLHGLSLRWHLGRKTGEVLRVMDRGTTSINSLLNYILFNIAPTIIDIIIAIVYFLTAFGPWFALIVFVTMALYLIATILVTEWRTKFRREMNKLDNERNTKGVDSLLNFETVKYYSAEDFEVERYRDAILAYQKAEFVSNASLVLLGTVQNIIINLGFAAGAFLCAWYVVEHKGLTVGDFVLFATYIMQLYVPLNWLGTYYRMIQQAFIDMENMFDLLTEKHEITDVTYAPDLQVSKGLIEFNNVTFHYVPEKPILKNVSFVVPPGQTFALVGPSGAGKSTIIRLLFRFYDVQSGTIRFDGQDISKVKQKTLRQSIGVVPQDTVLFNDIIQYNIRYGRVSATDVEVEEAAKAADIHEKILTFPEGYSTKVGERGLKLSGGEKQRVAIARTILKSPEFVLLDEATSALDTQTERNIQSSLAKVCENRTTIIVAHRLSTIIHAHQILVLQDGEIVERGTHEELLAKGDVYAGMWQQQLMKVEESSEENDGTTSGEEHSKQLPNGKQAS